LLTDQGTPYLAEAARRAYDTMGLEHTPQREAMLWVSRRNETSMWSAPVTSVADSHDLFLSRLDRMASHSLCTLRGHGRPCTSLRPRNTRYRLGRYSLPGRSISCRGTARGFSSMSCRILLLHLHLAHSD
jgi:hypothetical protein